MILISVVYYHLWCILAYVHHYSSVASEQKVQTSWSWCVFALSWIHHSSCYFSHWTNTQRRFRLIAHLTGDSELIWYSGVIAQEIRINTHTHTHMNVIWMRIWSLDSKHSLSVCCKTAEVERSFFTHTGYFRLFSWPDVGDRGCVNAFVFGRCDLCVCVSAVSEEMSFDIQSRFTHTGTSDSLLTQEKSVLLWYSYNYELRLWT